jgi:hypothetical protein
MSQHSVAKVPDLKTYALPDGALCLTKDGWGYGSPYLLNVVFQGGTFKSVMDSVDANYRNLLGPGEIQMVTENPDGAMTQQGRMVTGYLVFIPTPGEELS